ncbi:MAG: HDOD domain-containing protein [Aquificaceae bacterium]|nr:HDOD domain-containing protein [Aquificaceae bacterium]
MSFLIAKQPIFDKEGKRFAFEVFLRKKENIYEYPKEVPYSRATYIIVEILLEQGLEMVGEGKRVMLNLSLDSLINKSMESLDPRKLIIEIIEPQIPFGEVVYRQVLNTMDRYIQQGALFSMDERQLDKEKMANLLDKVQIISANIKSLSPKVVELAKVKGKALLISRIEEEEEYRKASKIGDFFQGIYLERPIILKEFQTAPYLKTTLLKLMAFIHSAQSPKEVANLIATDVGMTTKILRFVNSAYYSPIREIKSVEQACAMLGLKTLKNFLLVLAMNDYISVENPELWKKSLIRAITAQKLAEVLNPKYESEAYLMGLFSLIDEILNMDKIIFLKEVKVNQEIIEGYAGRNPLLRNILEYSIMLEESYKDLMKRENPMEDERLVNLERLTGIERKKLLSFVKFAFDTADSILKL